MSEETKKKRIFANLKTIGSWLLAIGVKVQQPTARC